MKDYRKFMLTKKQRNTLMRERNKRPITENTCAWADYYDKSKPDTIAAECIMWFFSLTILSMVIYYLYRLIIWIVG